MKYYAVAILTLLISCVKTDNEEAQLVELKGEELDFVELLSPYHFESFGDYFLIADRASDHVIHIYSLSQRKKLVAYGQQGNGPKEFGYLHFTSQNFQENEQDFVWTIDWEKMSASLLCVQDMLENIDYSPHQQIDFHVDLGIPDRVVFVGDSLVVGTPNLDADGRFFIFADSSVNWIPFSPDLPYDIPQNIKQIIYKTSFDVRHDSIFTGMFAFDGIEIFDQLGSVLVSTISENSQLKDPYDFTSGFFPDQTKLYTEGIYALEKDLLLIKNNNTYQDWVDMPVDINPTVVELYASNLQLKDRFVLDHYAVGNIFNKQRGTLITVSQTNDERELVFCEYQLPNQN